VSMRSTAKLRQDVHWLATLLLAAGLVPAFLLLKLPFRFAWMNFLSSYWISLTLQSIPVAVLLYLVGFPARQTLGPLWDRYRGQKLRIVGLIVFVALMVSVLTPVVAVIFIVATVALLEVVDRARGDSALLVRWLTALVVPAAYLFVGLILVFTYNDVIAAARYTGAYDRAFLRMDSLLLLGKSVSGWSRYAAVHFGLPFFRFLEFIYFRMFPQIGAALIITAFCFGKREALRFAGTILTAYYLALVIFLIWPSMGPFFTCPAHFSEFPPSLVTYAAQKNFLVKAGLLWNHRPIFEIDTDFFIAFPCMHIAQPLIVMWFLRRWKGMVICLAIYDLVLIPAILLLEWHYAVDLIGGVLVAGLAIALTYSSNERQGSGQLKPVAAAPAETSVTGRA